MGINRAQRLSGINPLSYLGVEPLTPPLLVINNIAPTPNDSHGFFLGSIWVVTPANPTYEIWVLVSLADGVATWIQIFPIAATGLTFQANDGSTAEPNGAGIIVLEGDMGGALINTTATGNIVTFHLSGTIATKYHTDDGNNAIPSAGTLDVFGGQTGVLSGVGININTQSTANEVLIALNNTIKWPNTTANGLNGIIYFNNNTFLHNFGTDNTFVGQNSGNLTLTTVSATANTGFGTDTLASLTTGNSNNAFGNNALQFATTASRNCAFGVNSLLGVTISDDNTAVGDRTMTFYISGVTTGANTAIGSSSLRFLSTGLYNIALGYNSGTSYIGSESSNIVIGSTGVAAEANTIRIGGGTGAGPQQQNRFFASGINGSSITATGVVQINASDQLSATNGTNGQVLIGGGTGPVWSTLTAGANITITNAANSITIASGGGGTGILSITGNSGGPIGADGANNINVVGTNVITVSGAGHTETISLTNGTNGQLLIGGGAAPLWANLTSVGATVTITNGANSINLEATGGAGTTSFATDSGTANEAGGSVTIAGGSNINTSGGGHTVTVNLDNTVSISGTFTSTGNILTTAGGFTGGSITTTGNGLINGTFRVSSLGAGVVQTGATGIFSSTNGTNGQILIGGGAAPVWNTITAGTGITIANAPNNITISTSGGVGGTAEFSYVQASIAPYVYGCGNVSAVPYSLGSAVSLTQIFDPMGVFFPGDGVGGEAFFTAPATGKYQFFFSLTTRNNSLAPTILSVLPVLKITTTARVYQNGVSNVSQTASGANSFIYTDTFSVLADMTMGDTATFSCEAFVVSCGGTGATARLDVYGNGTGTLYTYIQGYRVS